MNKSKVAKFAAPSIVALGAFVVAGILGTFIGEKIGYTDGFLYLFAAIGSSKLSSLLQAKMSK